MTPSQLQHTHHCKNRNPFSLFKQLFRTHKIMSDKKHNNVYPSEQERIAWCLSHPERLRGATALFEQAAMELKEKGLTRRDLLMFGLDYMYVCMCTLETKREKLEEIQFRDKYLMLPGEVRARMSEDAYVAAMTARGDTQ